LQDFFCPLKKISNHFEKQQISIPLVCIYTITMNIYIGNLDYAVNEQNLQELFQQYGEVATAKIITDKFTGRSKGFGFVEMPNDGDATSAIEALNGTAMKNRNISVTEARPKEEGAGNRGGGGFNRGGDRGGFNRGGDRGGDRGGERRFNRD
jgi:RNA recognition motif-containing protein